MSERPIFVTNFNPRFTGVSATAANVLRAHLRMGLDVRLVGHPLPGCPAPITVRAALTQSAAAPSLWHVRRNPEMRTAIIARDLRRLPIRIVFTSAAIRRHSWYPRQLINRMDAVIATSEAAAGFVPHVKAVVPHGVDTALFQPAENRDAAWRALGYPGDYGIATVGRIRPEKGTDRFVDAMIAALPRLPGATALVVGSAQGKHMGFEDGLKARIAAAGLTDRFVFTGELAADAIPALMRALAVLVQLPRYEGYGMTVLEAMASGVPFVATDTGAFAQFASHGAHGRICANTEGAGFAEAIIAMTKADGAQGRRAALDLFSVDREAEGIKAVYDGVWV